MENKLRPALIGGIMLGLLAGFPYTSCCVWSILGGMLACYLYIKRSAETVIPGEGAVLGAMTGLIGGVVQVFVGIPLAILVGNPYMGFMIRLVERLDPQQADLLRQRLEAMRGKPFFAQVLAQLPGALLGFVLTIVFATVGGLIAVAVFEKRPRAPIAPPPLPGF